jgi:outer membrane protein, heavy metal efflux system
MFRTFLFFLFPSFLFAEAVGPEALVVLAFNNNPALAAAQARTDATEARIPQARSLPDPELGYGYYAQRMNSRQELMVRQRFPYPGTLNLRGEVAGAAADVAILGTEALRRNLIADIYTLYADLAYLDATRSILQRNSDLFVQTENLIEGRIAAGRAGSAELLRTRIARTRIEDEIAALEARRPALVAQLNAVIGQSSESSLPALVPLTEHVAVGVAPSVGYTSAYLQGLSQNPEILAIDRTLAGQRSEIELARRAGRPDFSVGGEWMDTGSGRRDEVKLLFGVSLPIWRDRYRAAEREARAEVRASENDRLNQLYALEAELREAKQARADALRRVQLYRDTLIPQAREVVTAEESAYQAGQVDLLNLIEAQRVLLDLERIEQAALAEQVRAEAIIRRILG